MRLTGIQWQLLLRIYNEGKLFVVRLEEIKKQLRILEGLALVMSNRTNEGIDTEEYRLTPLGESIAQQAVNKATEYLSDNAKVILKGEVVVSSKET